MSKNIQQVFATNSITSNVGTDLMYFGRSPYSITDDAAMTYANFSAQFGSPYTPSALTSTSDTNVTISLGGSPTNALLHAASITMGWAGQLSPGRGGTGINNGTNTFTIGGNFQMSGAFTFNGTLTGNTAVTFPTSGTLATTSQIPTGTALTSTNDTNVTLTLGGSPATSLINPASITAGWLGTLSGVRGGTGVNNGTNTATFAGNLNFANSFTTLGNFPVTQTYTGTTNVTFPTAGTLATTSQLPTPSPLTANNDTNVTLTLAGTPATALLQASSITAGWLGTLAPVRGGLGSSSVPTNGQIPIGNGTNYTPNTLVAGTGIAIQNNPGSITISASGAGSWVNQTTGSVTMIANTTYSINNGPTPVLLTLPSTANGGDFIRILGFSGGGWIIGLNGAVGGQVVNYGNLTTSVSGSISSNNQNDGITLHCVFNGSVIWTVSSAVGLINVN